MSKKHYLKFPALSLKLGGRSRASIHRDMRDRGFPKPINLGPNSVVWDEEEVEAWVARLKQNEYVPTPVAPGAKVAGLARPRGCVMMAFRPAKHATMRPDGRSAKGVPKADNWFSKVYINEHVLIPAWRHLTKTATDLAIICIAKQGRAAAYKEKFGGRPVFQFTVTEGTRLLSISRTTFTRAIHELMELGFIELLSPGGIVGGRGRAADYTLSKAWRTWQPPPRKTSNIQKARAARSKK